MHSIWMFDYVTKHCKYLLQDALLYTSKICSKAILINVWRHQRVKHFAWTRKFVRESLENSRKFGKQFFIVLPGVWPGHYRPWPDDQTLFVNQFASQAKCFAVWPRHKTLLGKNFLLASSKKFFWNFSKTSRSEFCLLMLVKQCFATWPNIQTLFDKQISNVC